MWTPRIWTTARQAEGRPTIGMYDGPDGKLIPPMGCRNRSGNLSLAALHSLAGCALSIQNRSAQPSTCRRLHAHRYQRPAFTIDTVDMAVDIDGDEVRVLASLAMRREGEGPCRLNAEFFELIAVRIDGRELNEAARQIRDGYLTLDPVPDAFTLEVETRFDPGHNTALSGIYTSAGRIFSQCEAEGFRRIIPFIDRPDVLSVYTVTITADAERYPYLLSNGNCVEAARLPDGRAFLVTHDVRTKDARFYVPLAVTPLRKVTGWNWLLRFRRMLGLFAFFYILLHFIVWLVLDRGIAFGPAWDYVFEDIFERPFITIGFSALLILLGLAATSTAAMRRRMGRSWQKLHNWIYVAAILGVWHYWWQVKLDASDPAIYATILAVLLGYRAWTRKKAARAPP